MPAGVSWTKYLTFTVSALLSMMAGAQVVHLYYKPMADFETYIENEKKKLQTKS